MRMYLSSYLWGNKPDYLFNMVDANKRHVALITNSGDQFPEAGVLERFEQDKSYLEGVGFTAERLDLRNYFEKDGTELAATLKGFGLIWVRGANVFVLRRAMKQSGLDKIIMQMLKNDEIVYGGFSAGACVMGTTLHGLDLVDDSEVAPAGYNKEIIWDGLGILPFAVAPHYKSDHPESKLIDEAIDYFKANQFPYKALRDGEALYGNNSDWSVVS